MKRRTNTWAVTWALVTKKGKTVITNNTRISSILFIISRELIIIHNRDNRCNYLCRHVNLNSNLNLIVELLMLKWLLVVLIIKVFQMSKGLWIYRQKRLHSKKTSKSKKEKGNQICKFNFCNKNSFQK